MSEQEFGMGGVKKGFMYIHEWHFSKRG